MLDLATTASVAGTLFQEYMAGMPAGDDFATYSLLVVFGESSPTTFSERMGMPLTTASDRLNRLVTKGHAERVRNPMDARSFLFRLTDEGWAAFREAQPKFVELMDHLTERLEMPQEEIRVALQALERAMREQLADLNEKKTPAP
jgi:DNA-binding MarR family transcriptional regulator